MSEELKNAVTVDTVHTHTQCNLINKTEGMKNALFNINVRDG